MHLVHDLEAVDLLSRFTDLVLDADAHVELLLQLLEEIGEDVLVVHDLGDEAVLKHLNLLLLVGLIINGSFLGLFDRVVLFKDHACVVNIRLVAYIWIPGVDALCQLIDSVQEHVLLVQVNNRKDLPLSLLLGILDLLQVLLLLDLYF